MDTMTMRWMRWCVAVVMLVGLLVAAGCNTVEGAGKDVEKAGEAVQRAAD